MNIRNLISTAAAVVLLGVGLNPVTVHSTSAANDAQPAPYAAAATQGGTGGSVVSHRGNASDWTWLDAGFRERFDPTEARHGHGGRTITWHFHQLKSGSGYNVGLIKAAYHNLHAVTGWNFRQVHTDAAADIVITWKAGQGAGVLAQGGPTAFSSRPDTGNWAITRSVITISPNEKNYDSAVQRRIVIEHETGHALGLGHAHGADAKNEIMGPNIGYSTAKTFGRGDVAGLHHVSAWAGAVR